eukprot:gene923-1789_t
MSWVCNSFEDDSNCNEIIGLKYTSYRNKMMNNFEKPGKEKGGQHTGELATARAAHEIDVENLNKALAAQKAVMARQVHAAQAAAEEAIKRAQQAEDLVHNLHNTNIQLKKTLESTPVPVQVPVVVVPHGPSIEELEQSNDALQLKVVSHERVIMILKESNKHIQQELETERFLISLNEKLFEDLGREQAARKKLHNEMEDLKGRIRVYVRIRPMSGTETARRCQEAVLADGSHAVQVRGVGSAASQKTYDFDKVYGAGNDSSGSGGGDGSDEAYDSNGSFSPSAGILPRAVVELYRLLEERTAQITFNVEIQMFQLYKDKLEDLLTDVCKQRPVRYTDNKQQQQQQQGSLRVILADHSPSGLVEVEGASRHVASTATAALQILASGSSRRSTSSTRLNSESSRSHLICVLVVRLTNRRTKTTTIGKLTLVDLAGSERVDKSGAQGEVLKEAQSINKSLSALGGVIAAVSNGSNHIPYRDHALTMLMSDSIGGNAKTLMFVNCSPADYNNVESNNSLAFAARCKDITNIIAGAQLGTGQQSIISSLKKEIIRLKRAEKESPRSSKKSDRSRFASPARSLSDVESVTSDTR